MTLNDSTAGCPRCGGLAACWCPPASTSAPVSPKTKQEKRWAELTTICNEHGVFADAVTALSDPGESKVDFIDRECCDRKWVVSVTLTYEVPS